MVDRIDIPDEQEFQQELFPVASWFPDGGSVESFAVTSISETFVGRVTHNKRPFRAGAQLDDTGADPLSWSIDVPINSTLSEPGLGSVVYPQSADKFTSALRAGVTGTLVLPTRGAVRVKCTGYTRIEGPDEGLDHASITATFDADNEDSLDAASIKSSSVKGSAVREATVTEFTADRDGVRMGSLIDLRETLSELAGIINAPGDAIHDLQTQALSVQAGLDEVESALFGLGDLVGGQSTASGGSSQSAVFDNGQPETLFALTSVRDMVGDAEQERADRIGRIRSYPVERNTTLSAISSRLQQDFAELLELNSARIENPNDLRQGDRILIFEDA